MADFVKKLNEMLEIKKVNNFLPTYRQTDRKNKSRVGVVLENMHQSQTKNQIEMVELRMSFKIKKKKKYVKIEKLLRDKEMI